jgi:hypothetical protein
MLCAFSNVRLTGLSTAALLHRLFAGEPCTRGNADIVHHTTRQACVEFTTQATRHSPRLKPTHPQPSVHEEPRSVAAKISHNRPNSRKNTALHVFDLREISSHHTITRIPSRETAVIVI